MIAKEDSHAPQYQRTPIPVVNNVKMPGKIPRLPKLHKLQEGTLLYWAE
jgi:hypothetical protein